MPMLMAILVNAGKNGWVALNVYLYIAMNIEEKKQQRAMLLHFAGPSVDEIFGTLPDTGEAKDYDN